MTSNDCIAAWKNPLVRAHLSEHELAMVPENPAGCPPFDADPANCAGGRLPATVVTISPVTAFLSCTLACSQTMWDGSCDFFTYGCC
jgi:mersacidin/lichenicidin family type 2 lantibiotic